jgi:hypothetical protein
MLEAAAPRVNLSPIEFRWWFDQLRGKPEYLERDNWPEVFSAARANTLARVGEVAKRTLLGVLERGPIVFGRMTPAERLACIPNADVREFAEEADGTRSAIVQGETGIGKSAAAVHVLARLVLAATMETLIERPMREGRRGDLGTRIEPGVAWVRALDLGTPQNQWGLTPGFVERFDALGTVRVLVIDDLGWEFAREAVVQLLHRRYDAERVTYVTTGLTYDELASRYGGALIRRIAGRGGRVDTFGSPLRALRGGAS